MKVLLKHGNEVADVTDWSLAEVETFMDMFLENGFDVCLKVV